MRPGTQERIEHYRRRAAAGEPIFEGFRRPDVGDDDNMIEDIPSLLSRKQA